MLIVYVHSGEVRKDIAYRLHGARVVYVDLSAFTWELAEEAAVLIFQVPLAKAEVGLKLRTVLSESHDISRNRLFLGNVGARSEVVQANALGCSLFMAADAKIGKIQEFVSSALSALVPSGQHRRFLAMGNARTVLDGFFTGFADGRTLESAAIEQSTKSIAEACENLGVSGWLDAVREYHNGTYQHVLAVTGIAHSLSKVIDPQGDVSSRLVLAAMLHDVGKTGVPLAILEKPGKLDDDEFEVIKGHPRLGYDYLKNHAELDEDVLDAVLHHHEYLDGSGYPHGLRSDSIPMTTRILTVADIYGALLEKRSYKQPLMPHVAQTVLEKMGAGGKLDLRLVAAMRMVTSSLENGLGQDEFRDPSGNRNDLRRSRPVSFAAVNPPSPLAGPSGGERNGPPGGGPAQGR